VDRNNLATVAFVGFDARGPAVKVLRDIVLNEVGLIESDNPQMVICSEDSDSVLEVMEKFPSSVVRVLFNGELGAADFNRFDYVIGWEARSLGPRYVSMHPALRLRDTPFLKVEADLIPENPIEDRRFCSFIYTNGLAHPVRDQFFHKLNSIQRVDSWGGHLNNAGPLQNTAAKMGYELEKMLLESKYKFSIAIENGVYPGYTTEKIFSAIRAGAIPIYWGNPAISQVVNPARILSLHDYGSLDMAVESILELAGDKSRLLEILKQPMMTAQQVADVSLNKAELIELIHRASNTALNGEVLRPMGTTAATFELRFGLMLKREKQVEKFKYLIFRILSKAGLIKIFMQALNWLRGLRKKS
jgi:hypothetical protein